MDTLDKIKAAVASIEEQLPLSLQYESDRDTWPERWRQLKIAIDAAGSQPKESARKIAAWIWSRAGLDADDESWCDMMFDDAVERIDKVLRKQDKG